MREFCTYGSVGGPAGNRRPYPARGPKSATAANAAVSMSPSATTRPHQRRRKDTSDTQV
jgi:hypothetical protein